VEGRLAGALMQAHLHVSRQREERKLWWDDDELAGKNLVLQRLAGAESNTFVRSKSPEGNWKRGHLRFVAMYSGAVALATQYLHQLTMEVAEMSG
jgi:hypothetical protein